MQNIIIGAFIAWNVYCFILFGIDKRRSKRGMYRISERRLIMSAWLMGAAGGLLGMSAFRHKTKHTKFIVLIPLAAVFNLFIIVAAFYFYHL